MPSPPDEVTLPTPVTVTLPPPNVFAKMPVTLPDTLPVLLTVTLPLLLAPVTAAAIPKPPTALTLPEPPTVMDPLVPARLLFWRAEMPVPAVEETKLPPVIVIFPVPLVNPEMPLKPEIVPERSIRTFDAFAPLLMMATIPLPVVPEALPLPLTVTPPD